MPTFQYTAVDASGKQTKGTVTANNQDEASAQIKAQNVFPTAVVEVSGAATNAATPKAAKTGGRIPSKVLTVFTRQLATLIDAGLPLLRSLRTLVKQEKNPMLRGTMQVLAEAVESGSTFSEALAQHPKMFNKLYINMVKAGELGGVLETVLARLAEFQEKSQRIKGKVVSAMVYPIVVLFIAVVILLFLMIFIVPKFEAIFVDMLEGKPLPVLTVIVIAISRFTMGYWWVILILIGGAIGGYKAMTATPAGSAFKDKMFLSMPMFGDLMKKTSIARFSRTLGTLVQSGVPILQALNITKDTAGNVVISAAIAKVHDAVKEGESMVTPLEASGLFPPMVISMIQVGEETGNLPIMLNKIADVYEEEVDVSVSGLTSVIEPIMIVALAAIVGTIVIALFLPLVSIITQLSQ